MNLVATLKGISEDTWWKIGILALCLGAICLLVSIAKANPTPTLEKDSIRRYKILSYNPPKHFYVDIQDVETKQIYNSTYVSKHCNSYRDIEVGSEYNLKIHHYVSNRERDKGKRYIEFYNLKNELCY